MSDLTCMEHVEVNQVGLTSYRLQVAHRFMKIIHDIKKHGNLIVVDGRARETAIVVLS